MFKHILFIILFVTLGNHLRSQFFTGGLKLGIASTQIDGDGYSGFNQQGVVLGAFVGTDINEDWSALMEMQWAQKGSFDPSDPKNGITQSYRIKLNYIEIPVLLRYKVNKFRLETGPSFGYLFSDRESDQNGTVNVPFYEFKTFELAYNIGMSYYFTPQLYFNMRYQRSFLPIADDVRFDQNALGFFGGSYNTVLQFSANYQFNLSR